jgi:hypothetical protein
LIVSNGEKQELVVANCDKQELFDWLDIIARLKDDYTQEEIGNKIGWSRGLIANYSALLSNIVEEVIEIARNYKEGRSTKNVEGTTFIFTQNWFRTVGVEVK